MKKILFSSIFMLLVLQGISQQEFRLHLQPGKPQLAGDGDDYTTLVITARDSEGEIIVSMNGKVAVRVSTGFIDETEVPMVDGVAMVKYTSPMFGTPIKASQRMVYFMFRFMQKFIGRSAGSTDTRANQKLATEITLETFKEGLNPFALIPKKDGDNFAYIVCEMNGVRGKGEIEILKSAEGRNGNIVPGVYYGRDITGQSDWELNISSSGKGTFGEANASGQEANTIVFTNETFTEFNDAMGKMAGMGGFMKAYLGPPEKELKYIKDFDITKSGMPSAYMPMPKNGVFVYVPPILFEYAGRRTVASSDGEPGKNEPGQEAPRSEKSGIVLSQDKIVGDGRSRTKAVFHYVDEKGVPVAGKTITWEIPKELKVISSQTVTDALGNAEAVLEAPIIKATGEVRGENTKEVTNNYSLFDLKVKYTSLKDKPESTQTPLSIYKVLEQNLYILKPGMEASPYKVLLPQLEFYNLESNVFALVSVSGAVGGTQKLALNDAIVFLESQDFDREYFQRNYDNYFKKDRKMFMSMLENKQGGYSAITDKNGKFKLIIRDFGGKSRLFSGDNDRTMPIEPLQAKIADLTGRRSGALISVLDLLAAGPSADATDEGSFSAGALATMDYKQKVLGQIFGMEAMLCSGKFEESMGVEEKLHLIGMLMTNAKSTSQLMDDTGKEFIGHAWNLFYMLIELVNEKCKIMESFGNYAGSTRPGTFAGEQWSKLDLALASKLAGESRSSGVKRLIRSKLTELMTNTPSANKAQASAGYYRVISNLKESAKGACVNKLVDAFSEAFSKINPLPDGAVAMTKAYYYSDLRTEVDRLLSQPPDKVHIVYSRLQPHLRDYSTDIRTHYLSIANTRFNAEIYKADWDFFRESVVKGGLMAFDVTTGNFTAIKAHMEALDKFNKVTDAAYETSGLLLELWNYSYLWGEAKSGFTVANNSIENGTITIAMQDDDHLGFSLFNSAMAAEPPSSEYSSGNLNLANIDFSLKEGKIPVESINKAMQSQTAYFQWVETNIYPEGKLIGYNPEAAAAVFKTGNVFDDQFRLLLVNAWAFTVNNSSETQKAYQQAASQLQKTSSLLAVSADKAQSEIKKIPAKVSVELPEESGNSGLVFWENPLYRNVGIGILTLAVLSLLTVFLVRRKRRKDKTIIQAGEPNLPVMPQTDYPQHHYPPVTATPTPLQPPTATSPNVKFCPQCGTAFKPGAKFCGKCGYKTM